MRKVEPVYRAICVLGVHETFTRGKEYRISEANEQGLVWAFDADGTDKLVGTSKKVFAGRVELEPVPKEEPMELKMLMYKNKYLAVKSKNAEAQRILTSYIKNLRTCGNFLVSEMPGMAKRHFKDADWLEKFTSTLSEHATGGYVNTPEVLVEKLRMIEAQVDKIRNAGHPMMEKLYLKKLLEMFDPESGNLKELSKL